MHIHPTFKEKDEDTHNGDCKAKGRFLNDDGEVLDYKGYQNRYDFNFKANCTNDGKTRPTDISLQVTQVGLADKFKPVDSNDYNITNNDYLGKIELYNTRADYFLMNATYKVKVWWLDNQAGSMDLSMNAEFDDATNHTVISGINIGNG